MALSPFLSPEIVPDGVPPPGAPVPEVGEVVEDVLVDVGKHQLLVGHAQDGHGDQADVRVLRLRLVGQAEQARVELAGERVQGVELGRRQAAAGTAGAHRRGRGAGPVVGGGMGGGGRRRRRWDLREGFPIGGC